MPDVSIEDFKCASSLSTKPSESVNEYLDRLSVEAGVPEQTLSLSKSYFSKRLFSPDSRATAEENRAVAEFLRSLEAIASSSHSERDGSIEESEKAERYPDSAPDSCGTVARGSQAPMATVRFKNTLKTSLYTERDTVINWAHDAIENRPAFVVLLAVASYLFLFDLGSYPLATWDEAIYGIVARRMVQDGHWLTPTVQWGGFDDRFFFEKPPGVFWLQAISMLLFGISEFSVRLPSALAAIGTTILTYRFGEEMFDERTGLFASAIWVFTPYVLFGANAARTGGTDLPTVFFGTAFVYLTWKLTFSEHNQLRYVLAGASAAGLLLVKGFAAGVFVLVVIPLAAVGWGRFIHQDFLKTVATTIIITAPWPIYAYLHHPSEFVHQIYTRQVVERATGTSFVQFEGAFSFMRFPYFQGLFTYFDPWVYWLIPAALYLSLRVRRGDDTHKVGGLFNIWWFSVIIGVYAFTGNHGWYILPSYVPGAIVVAMLFSEASRGDRRAKGLTLLGTILVLIFSTRFSGISPLSVPKPTYNGRVLDILVPYPEGPLFAISILLTLTVVIKFDYIETRIRSLSQSDRQLAYTVLVCGILLMLLVGTVGLTPPIVNQSVKDSQEKALGLGMRGTTTEETVVYLQHQVLSETGPKTTMTFYAHRDVESRKIAAIVEDESVKYAVVSGNSIEDINRPYTVLMSAEGGRVVYIKFKE